MLLLVRDGQPQERALARQFIPFDGPQAKLRERGVGSLRDGKRAYHEGDGEVSVIRYASSDPAR